MSFPTGTVIPTTNLSSGSSNPSAARADLYDLVTAVNAIIASQNGESGVCVLTGSGKVPANQMPAQITLSSGVQVINPVDGVVNIRDVLRLQQLNTADVEARSDATAGDIAYVTDGDAGDACLAIYNGTDWCRVSLGAAIATS